MTKSTGVLGNYLDKVSATHFPIGDVVIATQCENVVPLDTQADCDSDTAISGLVGANGTVVFASTGVTMRVGAAYADTANGACNTGGSCVVIVTDGSITSQSAAIGFASPTVTASPTTVANGNGKTLVVSAKLFPIGDVIHALECDSAYSGNPAAHCDANTEITGTIGKTGSVVWASPTKIVVRTGSTTPQFADGAHGSCTAGGPACAVAIIDASNSAITGSASFQVA